MSDDIDGDGNVDGSIDLPGNRRVRSSFRFDNLHEWMPLVPKLIPILLAILIAGCTSQVPKGSDVVKPPQGIVIDVRTAGEYAGGHIPGAINIPYDVIAERIAETTADTSASIVVYCRSGRRSGIALATLAQMGYTNVVNEGGYEAYKKRLGIDD